MNGVLEPAWRINYPETMLIKVVFLVATIWISRVIGSALYGQCDSDDDCGTIDTVCEKGVCVCREDFTVWYDSCVPLPQPRVQCTKKHDCHKSLGVKSMCSKKNQCVCKAFHHLHLGQCVKNRDLHEACDHDHQCYCGADCQDKIACLHKNCSCKAGHSPYKSRRCISDALQPVVLTVADQQVQASEPQEEAVVVKQAATSGSGSGVSWLRWGVCLGLLLGQY